MKSRWEIWTIKVIEAVIVKTAVGKVQRVGQADTEQRGVEGNANAVRVDSGTHGNRDHDLIDLDITKVGHNVLVGTDIGAARGWVNKEGSRIIEQGCVEMVELSRRSIRKVRVIAEGDMPKSATAEKSVMVDVRRF